MFAFHDVTAAELPLVLRTILAPAGAQQPASQDAVAGFLSYVEATHLRWFCLRDAAAEAPRAAILALVLPGRTALVMFPEPGQFGIDLARQRAALRAGVDRLLAEDLHYAQALVEPTATEKGDALDAAGFRLLTCLRYLERETVYPWVPPPEPETITWRTFDATTSDLFARVVQATYADSLDCPELAGLRPIEDALASHQAAGLFDRAMWNLAIVDGMPAGCLLLARVPGSSIVEIVYTGVVPAFRRRGVGSLLMRRAFEQSRQVRAQRITVVVDERNTPARRLYEGFGFRDVGSRAAYYRRFW